MKTVLTIAGSDPSGGAGIQADLKTIEAFGLYGMSAITALTVQNTRGVQAVQPVSAAMIARQIDCIFDDIRPDAVKIGMLPDAEAVAAVAGRLRAHGAARIVLDPVLLSSSGHALLRPDAVGVLTARLLPQAALITPNLAEAEALSGAPVRTKSDMLRAARTLCARTGAAILVKGGHLQGGADDLLLADGDAQWFSAPRSDNPNTHGTGCTLSSAIACGLALGLPLPESVRRAKRYLTACIRAGLALGKGSGPLQHNLACAEEESKNTR